MADEAILTVAMLEIDMAEFMRLGRGSLRQSAGGAQSYSPTCSGGSSRRQVFVRRVCWRLGTWGHGSTPPCGWDDCSDSAPSGTGGVAEEAGGEGGRRERVLFAQSTCSIIGLSAVVGCREETGIVGVLGNGGGSRSVRARAAARQAWLRRDMKGLSSGCSWSSSVVVAVRAQHVVSCAVRVDAWYGVVWTRRAEARMLAAMMRWAESVERLEGTVGETTAVREAEGIQAAGSRCSACN